LGDHGDISRPKIYLPDWSIRMSDLVLTSLVPVMICVDPGDLLGEQYSVSIEVNEKQEASEDRRRLFVPISSE
jgi:hypothetical protein